MTQRGYGQFCPVAMAAEVVAERWTPLVLRELMFGSRRFNDLKRGVPRMSPTLLSQRLKELEAAGVVRREGDGRDYSLTEAGEQLRPLIVGLGIWGQRWLQHAVPEDNLDVNLLMWDLRRNVRTEALPPERRTVVEFVFSSEPPPRRCRWLVVDRSEVDLCLKRPGFEVDLWVRTDVRTLTMVWLGRLGVKAALRSGALALDGDAGLRTAFPRWIGLSTLAPHYPARGARAS